MKKIACFVFILAFLSCCIPEQDKVEKTSEDGVEVVINHLEPYRITAEPSNLLLEEELLIDMESEEIEEIGFVDIDYFDLDSEGNIYIVSTDPKDKLVFKFDKKGKYISSFGRKGQGPGEVQFVLYFGIDNQDRIIISDHVRKKVFFFSDEGALIEGTSYDPNFFTMFPLENGKYLFIRDLPDIENKRLSRSLRICNSEFDERKELDAYFTSRSSGGIRVSSPIFEWRISNGKIYAVNEQRGYEILVYDLEGTLTRKIRREYYPLDYPENLKKRYIEIYGTSRKIDFPETLPPIQSFFVDDEGRIFVMTYEKGENPGEHVFDIFNSEGVFIQRKNLNILNNWDMQAKAKKGRLYCVREKESGYKEFTVYRMNWK
jgi:hypothetical protein